MMSKPEISVIIVTYNVGGLITFCLDSVQKCSSSAQLEIIIVDNHSSDETLLIVKKNYPDISIIRNLQNVGFSKACNQGAAIAKSEVLLFLNPDCIVSEFAIDVLYQSLLSENVGIAGPLLIDGRGKILPESARAIPTLTGSVNKLLGSPFTFLNQYYCKIDLTGTFVVPVLSGACMMVLKREFEGISGFDEGYFMYGEDIDISVRMGNSGKSNLCVPSAKIIHFKGESTDKQKINYSRHFYNAMKIYAQKNIQKNQRKQWNWALSAATGLASFFNFLKLSFERIQLQFVDGAVIFGSIVGTQYLWSFLKSGDFNYYDFNKYMLNYLIYTIIWLTLLFLQGLYFDREHKVERIFKGVFYGTVVILILYALLPNELRFSRMIILLSSIGVFGALSLRYLLTDNKPRAQTIIVSDQIIPEHNLLLTTSDSKEIRTIKELENCDISGRMKYVFDVASLTYNGIIELMMRCSNNATFEFLDKRRGISFSSHNPDTKGDLNDIISHYHLSKRVFKIHKRIFDISCLIVLAIPVLLAGLISLKFKFRGWKDVLFGSKTIIGYELNDPGGLPLPRIRRGLIMCYEGENEYKNQMNSAVDYAANYTILDDIFISLSKLHLLIGKLN